MLAEMRGPGHLSGRLRLWERSRLRFWRLGEAEQACGSGCHPTDLGSFVSGIWRLEPATGANSSLQQKHRAAKAEAGTSPLRLQLPVELRRLAQATSLRRQRFLASPEGKCLLLC